MTATSRKIMEREDPEQRPGLRSPRPAAAGHGGKGRFRRGTPGRHLDRIVETLCHRTVLLEELDRTPRPHVVADGQQVLG